MKRAQTQHEPWFRTEEEWRAGLRERYRPEMLKALAVFDEMPSRPDEGARRAELLEDLLDLLEAGVDGGSGDVELDMEAIEARLIATVFAVQARIKQAVEERRRETVEG